MKLFFCPPPPIFIFEEMAINFCFLDDPTPHCKASRGFHRESYVSPVHSSSGDCCQLYTVGDRHKDCLGATFGRQCRTRSCTRCKRSLSRSVFSACTEPSFQKTPHTWSLVFAVSFTLCRTCMHARTQIHTRTQACTLAERVPLR